MSEENDLAARVGYLESQNKISRTLLKKEKKDRDWLVIAVSLLALVAITNKIEINLGWLKVSGAESEEISKSLESIQVIGALLFGAGGVFLANKNNDED